MDFAKLLEDNKIEVLGYKLEPMSIVLKVNNIEIAINVHGRMSKRLCLVTGYEEGEEEELTYYLLKLAHKGGRY